MLIKICGLKDPETARFTVEKGAHFIGIIFHPPSKRFVNEECAVDIVAAVKEAKGRAVGVFVDQSVEEIERICAKTGISYVQSYRPLKLKQELKRIYANQPDAPVRPEIDFLLMETQNPGSGETLDFATFKPPAETRWFLAGGLREDNVEEAIRLFHPRGVDASSGVEKDGKKDCFLIERFIEKVRSL